jgi:hypothetical protein
MKLAALLAVLGSCSAAEGDPRPTTAQGPLVIELFTSQGCSSCPPAEQLLGKLAHEPGARPLAPLAFHVDYWNGLGWADPFSAAMWTERQQAYSNALGDDRVYTPELVVGGATGMVGSWRDPIAKAIASAPRVDLLPTHARWTATALEVTATAPAGADVFVAVWQDGTHTRVPRGENAGATLIGDRVVRQLAKVASAGQTGTIRVPLDPAWHELGAVAFAQRDHHGIVASAWLPR